MTGTRPPQKASPLEVAKAVCWSFFGIRKRADYEKDAVRITLLQVVIAGLVGAAVFVLSLVLLVRYITG